MGNGQLNTAKNNGNIQSQTITVQRSNQNPLVLNQSYVYDSLNRLKTAEEVAGGTSAWKQTYSFDRYGNRNFDEANSSFPASFSNTALTNPAINTSDNRIASGQGYTYDPSGNMLTDAEGRSFAYDAENKQKEVKNASNQTIGLYYFDGEGRRVSRFSISDSGFRIGNRPSGLKSLDNPKSEIRKPKSAGPRRQIDDRQIRRRRRPPRLHRCGLWIGRDQNPQKEWHRLDVLPGRHA